MSRASILLLSTALAAGCSGGGYTENPAPSDTTAPTVSSTNPANGAGSVATTATVSATFSEAMDPATLTSSSFTLVDGSANAVSGSIAMSGGDTVATFTPSSVLAGSATYTAKVSTAATDVAGNPIAANYTWSFMTGPSDTAPPTVSSTTPTNGATGVSTATTVVVTFSEAMNAASVLSSFQVQDGGGNTVGGTITMSGGNTTATFTPTAALAHAATYTGIVSTGAQDASGNSLASTYSWSFTTAP